MWQRREKIGKLRWTDLRMIGTHHSATYSIGIGAYFSQCQNTRIYYQLFGGVRYLDIRVGIKLYWDSYALDPMITHGPVGGEPLRYFLEEIANFSRDFPTEFIIVSVKQVYDFLGIYRMSGAGRATVIEMIRQYLGPLLFTSYDDWFHPQRSTLDEMWSHNKRILVLFADELLRSVSMDGIFYDDIPRHRALRAGLFPRNLLYEPWPNKYHPVHVAETCHEFYVRRSTTRFFITQYISTPQIPILDFSFEFWTDILRKGYNLGSWLHEHPDYRIILLDFVFGWRQPVTGTVHWLCELDQILNANTGEPVTRIN